MVAQKKPHKTHARKLAGKTQRTRVPDSEICIKNIIPGSPTFIPHKQKPNKGSKEPKLKNSINAVEMACQKQTLNKAEREAIEE